MSEYPRRLHHDTPPWVANGALFHIRIRVAAEQHTPLAHAELSRDILNAVRRYHEAGHWWCKLFLLMPDHVHAMLAFPDPGEMATVIRNWKRGVAKYQGVRWQENFFDHRLRNGAEEDECWTYIRHNSVVKKLCEDEDAWPHWWSGEIESGFKQKKTR